MSEATSALFAIHTWRSAGIPVESVICGSRGQCSGLVAKSSAKPDDVGPAAGRDTRKRVARVHDAAVPCEDRGIVECAVISRNHDAVDLLEQEVTKKQLMMTRIPLISDASTRSRCSIVANGRRVARRSRSHMQERHVDFIMPIVATTLGNRIKIESRVDGDEEPVDMRPGPGVSPAGFVATAFNHPKDGLDTGAARACSSREPSCRVLESGPNAEVSIGRAGVMDDSPCTAA